MKNLTYTPAKSNKKSRNHTELPMSFNKDISETKQVAEECGSLNQERVSLDNLSIESSDRKCNSPPLAPNFKQAKEEIEKGCGNLYPVGENEAGTDFEHCGIHNGEIITLCPTCQATLSQQKLWCEDVIRRLKENIEFLKKIGKQIYVHMTGTWFEVNEQLALKEKELSEFEEIRKVLNGD